MNIENEIFKKSIINFDRLIPYGFKKISDKYILSKYILDNSFRVDVEIFDTSGIVKGKIIDLSFEQEYINYRIENQTGKFVNKIREEFESILLDIKENCTTVNYFVTNQANRISNLIMKKYNDIPEFIWDKFPGYGIFRNSNNKWYGLIMNINRCKIDKGDGEVEVLNVKLDEDKINELLSRKGFYKAYHMNKKNWISILLEDIIEDEEIMNYIEESHKFTEKVNK